MTTDNRNSFNAQIDAKTRLSFLKKIKNSVTPPSPLPPHGPCKAWTNHDHEFILMPAIGLLVLNSKIAYSTTKFCLGKFSVCGNKWMVNGSPHRPPPPPNSRLAGRVLSTTAVKEMIPQIPGYGFYEGRLIFLKIILPPSEWFWIVKPFVHLFNKTHRSGKQSPFPYSCLETFNTRRSFITFSSQR